MARETAHGIRRLTSNFEDGNRASGTYRRRYRNRDVNQERGPPRARLTGRVTHEDGSQVNSVVLGAHESPRTHTINPQDTSNDTTSLFFPEETEADQDSSLFCTQMTEPSQISRLAPAPKSIPPITLTNKARGIQGNRGNLYRGKDIIKLKVQNPKLRAIFANKPYPRAPKKHDGPVVRMGSKDKGL